MVKDVLVENDPDKSLNNLLNHTDKLTDNNFNLVFVPDILQLMH